MIYFFEKHWGVCYLIQTIAEPGIPHHLPSPRLLGIYCSSAELSTSRLCMLHDTGTGDPRFRVTLEIRFP
ncbi:hypothetical protein FA13DRAFT_1739809 [Coprinellus micaceus]|uniref:Uncharacterized protein n=1 Tax=Coprinellus micaceus TaxID=71717 RepID=A0A4Y7SPP8_COPMI|nr:hypothetical protein FA13DRAFT_1739809 [Coprinellus micaceus]